MAERRRTPSEEELRLWREAMRDARPLGRGRRQPKAAAPAPAPEAPPPAAAAPAVLAPALPPALPRLPRPALPPLVVGDKAGLDRRTDERLRRGRMEIDGRLDLHGMTQGEAHDALSAYVARAHREGRRVLLVITGKGKDDLTGNRGVLRSAVPRWLAEAPMRPYVLAVRQAQLHHGGAGALYVLLKRKRAP